MVDAELSAKRGDHEQLTALARKALAGGAGVHEVVTAVYGVDLPREAYLFHEARPQEAGLLVELLYLPWELLDLAYPAYTPDTPGEWAAEQEAHALAQAPDFLPLMQLVANDCRHDGYVIGYSIEQLKQGKTTILGHSEDIPESGASFEELGGSLFTVLREWMDDHVRKVTEQVKSPANRGFGSLTSDDVEAAEAKLRIVKNLQQRLATQ